MKLLVCGGAGFISSNFVRQRALENGDEVVVYDKLTYAGRKENIDGTGAKLIHAAIEDRDAMLSAVDGVDAVVNFAAETHVDRSIQEPDAFVKTHALGTYSVVEACRTTGVPLVQISTDEVYGSIAEGSWNEERPLEPNSPYSASKAGSDLLARSYFRTHGMNLSITRCSNNYGPFHFPEKVIPLFVTNLIDDKHVPLYGEGNNIRDWLHVDDHTRGIAMVLVGGRAGEIYNIGGGTELTNKELTQLLLDATGKDWSYVDRVADRLGHDLRYSVDISKIRAELGYEPLVPFEQGLADVVQWYRDNRQWWEPLKERAAL
jgi:dTDP-glucose 4,6-dehydratase